MGYSAVWKILEEMVADFRKKGRVVPSQIMSDLKSARTMIRILKTDASCREATQKMEEYLGSVESYLVSEGEKIFGAAYADEWLKRLSKARREVGKEEKEETRFVSELPRAQQWVRVRPSAQLSVDKLKELADDSSVSCKTQDDGSILVYGKKEHIMNFVRKMATKYGSKAEE
jgi:hypothetical protein